jgi:2-dehydro-3-deoxyphosphogluconate aldolase/(4S)-4-hydroxy-2-oxoglutarate aldolase
MRNRAEIVRRLTDPGLIAVIRTSNTAQVLPICEALLAGGIHALEITLTVPNALDAIRQASAQLGSRAVVGAGTVLNGASAQEVIGAGAQFVVSPITRLEIITAAHRQDIPAMIGAYTPTEAQSAYEAGADFIKLFPADKLGAGYVKSLLAPLPHLRIVPTGGVDLKTALDLLNAGCAALGVGSSLLTQDILRREDWTALTQAAREFVELVRSRKKPGLD